MTKISKSVIIVSTVFLIVGLLFAVITYSLNDKAGLSSDQYRRDLGIEVTGFFLSYTVAFVLAMVLIPLGLGGLAVWKKVLK